MKDPLIVYFEHYLPFTTEEKTLIKSKFTEHIVKRRENILQEGIICHYYSFIVKGCFRMYGVADDGTEHNIQFAAENDWIMDIGSFHTQKRSQLNIKALEPSVILKVEQQDLYLLYRSIPKLDRIFKVIIENKYVELQNHVLQNISSTAQKRYVNFLEQYPRLSSRLPSA